jgi:branched-chain amino acid transport system permease protein
MPAFANDFILFQVFGWTFILGMIALSLMFLAGYGGMVSLIQMSVAAMAGYMVAIFGSSPGSPRSHGPALVAQYPDRDHRRR